MLDLCLMNADKTDNSNTNRFRNQTPGIILPGVKPTGESICGDPHAVKQRSASTAGKAKNQKITGNNPNRVQKVTTGKAATKTNLLGNKRKSRRSVGDLRIN